MKNRIVGYARVSTDQQDYTMQVDALKNMKVEKIYSEKMTGTKSHRPELDEMRNRLESGDTVVIYSLSRLGRSTKDLLALVEEFRDNGVKLLSVKEQIDTETPSGRLLITILAAVAEFERDTIVQRTNDGLAAARARGRKGGRPRTDAKVIEKAVKLYRAQTHSLREISELTGISRTTIYRALEKEKSKG